jgi:hypothetical protein
MASPFADFPNIRLGWRRPTSAPTNLRDGLTGSGQIIAIDGFLTGDAVTRGQSTAGAAAVSARAAGLPTVITPGQRAGKVFIIRWALVPLGESCFDAGTSWTWDTTALRPVGMTASEQELQAYLGPIDALPTPAVGTIGTAVIDQVGGPAGDGGVGALLRQEAGDQLFITLRFPR